MSSLKLNNGFTFGIEPYEKRMRLIVYKDGAEAACRKESFGNLKRFILGDEKRLFKGRLQLVKNTESIIVEVKGEILGIISNGQLLHYLAQIKETK